MALASDRFVAAVARDHRALLRVEVLEGGNAIADSTADAALRVLGGQVQVVRRADVSRSVSVELLDVDGSLVPLAADDLLDPLARRELRVSRGIRYGPGDDELLPAGVFVLEKADVDEGTAGTTITVAGRDRSVRVAGNKWSAPYTIAAGTNVGVAIQALIEDRVPGVFTYAFSATAVVTSGSVTYEANADPWQAAQRLAEGIGYELLFDPEGVCTLRPVPDPDDVSVPVAQRFVGASSPRVAALTRSIDGTSPVNGIRVVSEAPWLLFPIRAEAWDDDPDSPTSRARIGEWPLEWRSPTIFSQAAADAAAAARLRIEGGVEEQLGWSSIPNPALGAGDVIELEAASVGGTIRAVVETLTIPLTAGGAMAGTTRRRRTA